ncbi:MAG: hypothetical protein AAGF02_02695 [Actinomycetota bacterium]
MAGTDRDAERVTMQNPNTGRDDGAIAKRMYDPVRAAILDAIREAGTLAFADLPAEVEARTPAELWDDASLGWYTTTVKLDLEAKGLLTRAGSPQQLRLA